MACLANIPFNCAMKENGIMGVLVGGVPLTFVTLRVHTTHKKQKTQKDKQRM